MFAGYIIFLTNSALRDATEKEKEEKKRHKCAYLAMKKSSSVRFNFRAF